jgi:hypothetical protein
VRSRSAETTTSLGGVNAGCRLEVEGSEALCRSGTLAGTAKQPSDPDRHVAEQRAEHRGVMPFACQHASTSHARAATLAHHDHLRRDHLSLKRGCQLLRLREPKSKVGYPAGNSDTSFTRHTSFATSHHPRPVSTKLTQVGTNPTTLHTLKLLEPGRSTVDNPLRNISVHWQATDPAAVIIV